MKKLLSILALALCFVACQNDAVESVSNSDLVDVVLTVDAPEMGITRGLDNDQRVGRSSALGAIDFFNDADWAKYDVRYILEVYAENAHGTGEPIYRERLVNCLDKYAPTTFALRLVPERTYKFVVFADFVADGNHTKVEAADKLAIADWYYDTRDLRNITIKSDATGFDAMNEARDAYFITKNVKVSTTGLNEPLTLTRPFAKLRVIATDLDYIAGYAKPGYVEVKYHTEKVIKSFNAVNGELSTDELSEAELTFKFDVQKDAPYTDGYDKESTNQTLFADYLLAVEGEQTTVNFTMAVYESEGGQLIHSHDFNTQIPIQRNHLTTIIGDLLTTQANIDITIDDNFEEKEFVYGWGDDNATTINVWNAGELNADGDYTFVVEGENDFKVTVNGAAVKNQKLTAGDYVLAEDAEEGAELTFTVEELQANETTRALTAVKVIGGTMNVQSLDDKYKITLDLVLEFSENKDVRHAIYVYDGPISFGKVLETPEVKAAVEGNVITLTWNAVADATSYTITGGTEMPVVTEETTYTFTGEYETEYTFNVVAVNDNLASQPYTIVVTTEAAPVVEEGYKLYFNNIAEWSAVYAHIWANEGEDLGLESVEWPGRELTETEVLDGETYYVFQLPATATGKTVNVVFNDGAGSQTKDLAGVADRNLFFDNCVEPVEPTDVKLYLNTGSDWYNDNGGNVWFAAYFFGNAGNTWTKMTPVEGEDYLFETTIPEGDYTSVIFTMMYGDKNGLDWGSKKNQTVDIVLPTDGSNCYTIENPWDESKDWKAWGSWSVYAPTVVEPEEPTALATPVVTYEINEEGNFVTLSWEAIEGAKDYTATYGENKLVVEGTTATFDAVVGTYTATVVANPADETKNTVSEAGTVEVTVEAPVVEPTYTTVAEFLAADVNDATFYTLKGTITRVANTNYGNFDLTDETGTIYVYGLYSEDGATNKYWAASGAQLGDDIVISAVRADYNGSAQAGSARFLGLTSPGTLAFWSFSKTATTFTSTGGEQVITVEAYNLADAITVASDNAQFSATYADGALTITALENTTTETINGNITVTAGALEQVITVAQGGVSVGGGTEGVAEATMKSFGWANSTVIKDPFKLDDNVSVTVAQNTAGTAPTYYDNGEALRLYQNGATMTITANGKTIKAIEFTFNDNYTYLETATPTYADGTWTGEATEVTFSTPKSSDKAHRAYISAIKVTYVD